MTGQQIPQTRERTSTADAATTRPAPIASPTPAVQPQQDLASGLAAMSLRITLAVVFLPHGAQKVFGLFGGAGYSATLSHFEQTWGVPAWLTIAVMAAELLGSIALAVGFLTRFCALAIAAVMVGAVAMVHLPHGFFMNWSGQQAGEGFEFHLLAIGMALTLVVLGGGRWSLDRRLFGRNRR